jgi:hypothetical protein
MGCQVLGARRVYKYFVPNGTLSQIKGGEDSPHSKFAAHRAEWQRPTTSKQQAMMKEYDRAVLITGLSFVFGPVDSDATDFDNPKFAGDGFDLQCFGKCFDGSKQFGISGAPGQTDNYDA